VTQERRRVIIACSSCGHRFEDWWRPLINPELAHVTPDILDQASPVECPRCHEAMRWDTLVLDDEGVLTKATDDRGERPVPT
jgi:hypothetical protein